MSWGLAGNEESKPFEPVVGLFSLNKARKGVDFVGGATGSVRGKEISYRRYLQLKAGLLQRRRVE